METELTILDLAGTAVVVLSVQPSQTILQLKQAIAASTGIPIAAQQLLGREGLLCNDDQLNEAVLPGDAAELSLVHLDRWPDFVVKDWKCLRKAPASIRNDPEIVLKAIEGSHGQAIKYAGEEARADKEIMLTAIQHNATVYKYAMGELCTDFCFVASAVDHLKATSNWGPSEVTVLRQWGCRNSKQLYAHPPFVLAVVAASGFELQYASEPLRADREVVLAACSQEPSALRYAAEELKADREFVLSVMQQQQMNQSVIPRLRQCLLGYVSRECRNDREIVQIAVQYCIKNLEHASSELQGDCEFIFLAMQAQEMPQIHQHCFLKYVSKKVRSDRRIVNIAVQQCGLNLQYASVELRSDPNIVALAVKQVPSAAQYATDMLQADHKFMMTLIKESPSAFEWLSCSCRADPSLALAAVLQFPYAYHYISQELSNNSAVAIAAVKKDWYLFFKMPPKLQQNRDVVMAAVHSRSCQTRDKVLQKMTVSSIVDQFLCQSVQVTRKKLFKSPGRSA